MSSRSPGSPSSPIPACKSQKAVIVCAPCESMCARPFESSRSVRISFCIVISSPLALVLTLFLDLGPLLLVELAVDDGERRSSASDLSSSSVELLCPENEKA